MGWHVQQLMQVPAAAKKMYGASLANDEEEGVTGNCMGAFRSQAEQSAKGASIALPSQQITEHTRASLEVNTQSECCLP